jgi:hypothetical protein
MHPASLYQMNDLPESTTSSHCAFHHARPQYGRILSILERSRNGTPCLTVLSLPSCSIMLLTDEVLWYRLVTYRAALLWTISNRWMSFCCHGSHTELAYSRVGRRFITRFQIKYIGVLSIDAYSYSSNVFPHKMISLYIS